MNFIRLTSVFFLVLIAALPRLASGDPITTPCPRLVLEPVQALLNHVLGDQPHNKLHGEMINPGPAYLLDTIGDPKCRIGPANHPASKGNAIIVKTKSQLDQIETQLGRVAFMFISKVEYVAPNRVIVNLSSGFTLSGEFSGCWGPAILVRDDGTWKFEVWSPNKCS